MELVATTPHHIHSPVFDNAGRLFFTCTTTGMLLSFDGGAVEQVLECQGSPSGVAFEPSTNEGYLADTERQSIVKLEKEASTGNLVVSEFIHQFEGRPLTGPQRIRFTPSGELVFTDGGLPGDSSVSHPSGSVYRTVQRRQQLLRLCGPSLAGPSGLAVHPTNGAIFVCETSLNRVLRFVPKADGHFVSSVWVQMQGSLGPVDIDIHPTTGDVYVAKYDCAEVSKGRRGRVVVFDASGEEKGIIEVPSTQISGIAISPDGKFLFIAIDSESNTEDSHLYRLPLQ